MNERIRQLALDAGIGFTLWDDSGREMIDNYTPEEQLAKFAELIVEECIHQVLTGVKCNPPQAEPPEIAKTLARRLQQHFGVEE